MKRLPLFFRIGRLEFMLDRAPMFSLFFFSSRCSYEDCGGHYLWLWWTVDVTKMRRVRETFA